MFRSEHPLRLLALTAGLVWSICQPAGGQQWISLVKNLPLGSVATISGTVISSQEFGDIRYVQDSTGGMAVFGNGTDNLLLGDSIRLTGVLSRYRGALQLSPVISIQLLATQKVTDTLVSGSIADIRSEDLTSRKVRLTCVGIASCEGRFEEGWYQLYDDQGEEARLWIGQNAVTGSTLTTGPLSITGIWTQLEGQYEIRAQNIQDAAEANCHLIPPASLSYNGDSPVLTWSGIGAMESFLVVRYDTIDLRTPLGIPSGAVQVQVDSVLPGHIHTARLEQEDMSGTMYASLPILFSKPLAAQHPVEILFNRPVDASFSDGSIPLATGSSVIESDVISRIDNVMSTLDIAMYNTTRSSIVQAVIRAAQRGVQVRYIADDETSNSALDMILPFPVKYRSGSGIMHHKFVIGDAISNERNWTWTGSTNFGANQLSQDPNHAIIFSDKAITRNYLIEFEELWGNDSTSNLNRSGDVKTNNTAHLLKVGGFEVESFFSPSDETNCHILSALQTAQHQALIGLLLLTRDDLTSQLIALHEAGVEVRVILEDEESSEEAVGRLRTAGVPLAIHDLSSIFHHKYAIIDEGHPDSDPQVISGSHNWTWSADNINDENTLILHDPSVANIFRQEFEARWSELNPTSVVVSSHHGLRCYPNPLSQRLTVDNPSPLTYRLSLSDMTGRVLVSDDIQSQQRNIILLPVSLPEGMYILRFTHPEDEVVLKMIRMQ